MLLAKRLINAFPKLINDIYISDEYFGESVLHMSIVNEDPPTLKFLLKSGADVQQRCCGNFFTADDQKASRTDSSEHEWADLSIKTNYSGHMYWGEYPLSFAACLDQEECFRLLRANGADPNAKDSNGNTVLHIMTIRENEEMFDVAVQLGANLHIKNRQGLIPLTLAAKLAKQKMFEHILNSERQTYWTYGGVICAAYPLTFTDSIQPETGQINRNSALALVVYGHSVDHLKCFNQILQELLRKKWNTFAKRRLFQQWAIFTTYFLLIFAAHLLRPTPLEKVIVSSQNSTHFSQACYLWHNNKSHDSLRLFLEFLCLFGATGYLVQARMEIKNVGRKLYFESLFGFPAKLLFLVSCILVVLMLPLRLACASKVEDVVGILAVLLTAVKFLFFCRGLKMVGPFVLMIYKIIVGDLLRFFLIYGVFAVGFSQAFYVIFLGYKRHGYPDYDPPEKGTNTIMYPVMESLLRMFMMSLNEFGVLYNELGYCSLALLGKVMFIIYICLVAILLMNLLIAMMTNTYTFISGSANEWLRQWAAIILVMEQGLTAKERLNAQLRYSSSMARDSTVRAIIVKWKISQAEQDEIKQEKKKERKEFEITAKMEEEARKNRRSSLLMSGSPTPAPPLALGPRLVLSPCFGTSTS